MNEPNSAHPPSEFSSSSAMQEMLSLMRGIHAMMEMRQGRAQTPQLENKAPSLPYPLYDTSTSSPLVELEDGIHDTLSPCSTMTDSETSYAVPFSSEAGPTPEPTLSTQQDSTHADSPPSNNAATEAPLKVISKSQADLEGEIKQEKGYQTNKPFRSTRFGLQKEQVHPTTVNYDYRLKYQMDERYHELDEDARVWWVYLDEAMASDNDMVGELGDSLDILLVFAGLFSAVLTTFCGTNITVAISEL
ncbi:hypothetical protein BDP27DRAFT_260291 [Rhodocollybia butyracea]|uniref:DUF6535 domain-containing protein n=1 Tax=Rhodocollybia butyracea TaxID=206335 RepID=A0A9P5PIZ0_9AGAR|nr:hypothetical protein BDP27DRAFT_260291 [Rhodocollybia butyracea]